MTDHDRELLRTGKAVEVPATPSGAVTEAMALIAEYAAARGVRGIKDLPGCWEIDLEHEGRFWHVAVNGHTKRIACAAGHMVPPFHAFIAYGGWPWGVIGPFGGVMGQGSEANEDTFLEALRAGIAGAKGER